MIIGKFLQSDLALEASDIRPRYSQYFSIANGLIKIDKFHSVMDDLHSLKFMEFYGIYGILCEVMNEVYGILWNFMKFHVRL